MKVEKDITIRLALIRCIGEMCKKGQDIAKDVLKVCGVPFFLDILNTKNEEVINASSYIIQVSVARKFLLKIATYFWLKSQPLLLSNKMKSTKFSESLQITNQTRVKSIFSVLGNFEYFVSS